MIDGQQQEVTKGMDAMRIRIVRAELLAGCQVSIYNAPIDGDLALAEQGPDSQPRTTTNGAILSVSISAEQNNTFSRAIRLGQKIFISRDGPNHPLYPTVRRLQLHPRVRALREPLVSAVDAALEDAEELPPNEVEPHANVVDASMIDSSKSMMWTTSTAVVSGAAWITMSNGLWNGKVSPTTYILGVMMLLGGK